MKLLRIYLLGYGISLVLTLAAFGLVQKHVDTGHAFPSHGALAFALVVLAIGQLAVQLVCFLHLDQEKKPRWNLAILALAAFIVAVIVGGTLWIMNHLEHGQAELSEIYPSGEISPQAQDD